MGRPIRYLPHPDTTFEVTCKTLHGRLLLRPSKVLNDLVLGVVGRALSLYPGVLLHLFVVLSNHMHLILTVPDSRTLSLFMCYINSNIAREVGRLHCWREKFWGRRYRAIAILDDQALLDRVAYVLSHGCKEGLVRRPEDWPGIHCVHALRDGVPLYGTWFHRTREYEARRAGSDDDPHRFSIPYPVPLSPLPCWKGIAKSETCLRFAELVKVIEAEYARSRETSGKPSVLGDRRVLAQSPHSRPAELKRSNAPLCHSATLESWMAFRDSYREFVEHFHSCARRLRKQRKLVPFPSHSFPPSVGYWEQHVAVPGPT